MLNSQLLPREKLSKYGASRLDDYELIALILGSGTKGKDVFKLSREVWKKYLLTPAITLQDLQKIKGLGEAKAVKIIAMVELCNRILIKKETNFSKPEIVWQSTLEYARSKKEYFLALYLDSRFKEIHREIISIGTVDASLVHPREVFEPGIRSSCSKVILVHNHPSGDTKPSNEDLNVTNQLVSAGELLGIPVVDHVIITSDKFFSLAEAGLI